jgi:hypothetical protein
MPAELMLIVGDEVVPLAIQTIPTDGWAEIKNWQQSIAAFLALGALLIPARYNFRLNRRRDAQLRDEQIDAVCSALYSEILILKRELAQLAKTVAKYEVRSSDFDKYFFDDHPLPKPVLFTALADSIGDLPPKLALSIITFYGWYDSSQSNVKLLTPSERTYNYAATAFLDPALKAIKGIEPALKEIEKRLNLPRADDEDTDDAEMIQDHIRDMFTSHGD